MHRGACAARTRALALLLLAVAVAPGAPAAERELAAPVDAFVEVEVATIGISTPTGTPVVLLREPAASEVFPIFIGTDQARSILQALRGAKPPRPMTHDLLGDVIGSLDARLVRVYVDAIVDHTFLGMLELEVAGHEDPVRVDTRPSDAIAVALRVGASIHVAPGVLDQVEMISYRALEERHQVVTAVGITVMAPTPELREALELPEREGLVVSNVIGLARGAGLEPGALLLAVNDELPDSPMHFLDLVRATPENEPVRIRYWQNGDEHDIELPTGVPDRPGATL